LGLKYYRISGRDVPSDKKEPYVPNWAREKAVVDAADFVGKRIRQAYKLRETFEGHPPHVVAPYDAELYGHWWFEGPQFLDFLFRELHYKKDSIEPITPGDFLDAKIPIQIQQPTASSWGANGYYKVWLNEGNSWMYPYQHDAERKMTEFANRFHEPSEIERRVLNQLARELLLAQSSDWAFQIYQGTTVQYSSNRFKAHIHRFDLLAKDLEKGEINEALLQEIESRDNIFAEVDYRIYRS
jgi:1,4-alpha-glucan branching enzyme